MSGLKPAEKRVPEVVIVAVATVRPWNPPWKTMTLGRPVAWRERRREASSASLPELAKKRLSRCAGSTPCSLSTRASSGWCMTVVYWPWMSLPTCSCAAATTLGWQWPVLTTPMPEVKSRWRLPSTSKTSEPRAWSIVTGVACFSRGDSAVIGTSEVGLFV